MNIREQIESIILYKGQPVSYMELAKLLDKKDQEIKTEVAALASGYEESGMHIVYNEHECELVTAPSTSDLISSLQKQELETELSNASLETLSIILYMGPIARSMIDFIRGVNSQFTLRSLLMRGLIEKSAQAKIPTYQVSLDTIKFLGLNKIDELPNFKEIRHNIAQFIKDNTHDSTQ